MKVVTSTDAVAAATGPTTPRPVAPSIRPSVLCQYMLSGTLQTRRKSIDSQFITALWHVPLCALARTGVPCGARPAGRGAWHLHRALCIMTGGVSALYSPTGLDWPGPDLTWQPAGYQCIVYQCPLKSQFYQPCKSGEDRFGRFWDNGSERNL